MDKPTPAKVKAWLDNATTQVFHIVDGTTVTDVKTYVADLEAKFMKLAAKLAELL